MEALAVLPFENVGGDSGMEPLSDGLADHIIRGLSHVRRRHFKVRPFTSVSRYKEAKTDVRTMGSDLNVKWIVTGALRREGEGLSVSVELVDAREDSHIWGKRYQGDIGGILDLQDRIARDVAAGVGLVLTGEDEKRLTRRSTEDPEAYLLYREGIHHFNRFSEEAVKTSIECFRRAIEKDPNYALAHAAMARSYVLLGSVHVGLRVTYPDVQRSVARALEIDESLPEAHSALAVIHLFHDWNWPAAERELKVVTGADDASLVPSWNLYSFYLAAFGRLPEALAAARRGQEIDPLAVPRRNEVAMCHNWMRRYDQAIAEARRAMELDPNFFLAYRELGLSYAQKGMHAEAIETLEKGLEVQDHPRLRGLLGYAYVLAGREAEARKVLEALRESPRYGSAFAIARIHAALGERDQAFEWLRKACDERDSLVIWLKVDATMDNLRADPRFAGVLKSMGLPP
jgi:TolB-like protein/tetratricopeptide (TPR) repeat protein